MWDLFAQAAEKVSFIAKVELKRLLVAILILVRVKRLSLVQVRK